MYVTLLIQVHDSTQMTQIGWIQADFTCVNQ